MQSGDRFDWRQLGKASYVSSAAIVASLPADVRSQIRGVSDELLRRLVHLMWYHAEHSGRGSAYCWPKLAKLGDYVRRSVRTVQRHLCDLIRAGLIQTVERYREGGQNTSSLYFPGKTLLAILFGRQKQKTSMKWPTTKMSANSLKNYIDEEPSTEAPSSLSMWEEIQRAKQSASLGASQIDSASDTWEEESYIERRRRELKYAVKPLPTPSVPVNDDDDWN